LTGQGFPVERRGPRGDQLVALQPVFPGRLDSDQEILVDQLIATPWHPDDSHLAARLDEWRRAQQAWEQARAKRGRHPGG
jgi:molecular chaperone DnaJ